MQDLAENTVNQKQLATTPSTNADQCPVFLRKKNIRRMLAAVMRLLMIPPHLKRLLHYFFKKLLVPVFNDIRHK